jgi:cellulose synthase/poly-beta-1,6-N-acetylglucosamine synthase-like glycosyltransferase
MLQAPAPTPWPSPIGSPPQDLFERYFHDGVYKTWGNISPLYQLDAFDWTILIVYFTILTTLAIYGSYRIKQVIDFWRYRKFVPTPAGTFAEADLPRITVQLPLFNELYVVDRLLKAVTAIDYPREKFEIQVLDDSTDETIKVAEAVVEKYKAQGFDIGSDRLQSGRAGKWNQVRERRSVCDLRRRFRSETRLPAQARRLLHRSTRRLRTDALVAHQRRL